MRRFASFLIPVVMVVGFLIPTSSAFAQTHTFTVTGANPTGCSIPSNPTSFFFNVTYTWPGAPLELVAKVTDPGITGLYGSSTATLPAGSGSGTPGFSFPTTAALPVPYPWSFTVHVVGRYNGEPLWQADVVISCPAAAGPYTATQTSNGPYVAGSAGGGGPIPGCDVEMAIPATAVGGTFVDNAAVYWAPGAMTNPPVVITMGNNARVLGIDSTGQYYQIIWACSYVWVPVSTMGPNYDDVWHGAPLPTNVIG